MDKKTDAIGKEFDKKNISRRVQRSARSKAIEDRSRISSADYNALEEHDQFYRDHKVLLHLFVILGIVPVHRRTGRITFAWKSPAFVYAFCLYVFTTSLVLMVGYQRVRILTVGSKKFDEYIYSIIFIVYLIPHFIIPFVGWFMADQVVHYKNSWGVYQLKYYRITGKAIEFPKLSILIIIISTGCLILAVVFLLSLSALLAGFTLYHTTAYYHIIIMINMNCALWYINCRAMGDASKSFADSFEEDIGDNCSAYILSKYRVLWLSLSEMLQKLGNTYARTYSAYSLFMFLNITIAVYGFMSEIIDHGLGFSFKEIGLFVDAVYCITLLYIFCECSEKATINIAKRVQDALMTIDMNTVEQGAKKEIDLFLVAIQMNPPVVSLKGYADVDKKFFTSSITMMAIYLIVLLQFKVSFQMMYSASN